MATLTRTKHERKMFKRSTIAACVMAATAIHAQAQEATDDPAILEEVVVYGIKQSLQNAQDIKRDASTVKDVITASDISALPDKSVLEALQRLPGVSIERFAASDDPDHFSAEGSGVVVRGLNRTRSEFNGRDSFSASRSSGLNFSDVPPELMGGVEVVKNTTADMIEGGISGTVNLITRKPFDKDGMVLAGSVRGSYGDRIKDTSPAWSGIFSNRWEVDAGEIGFLANISKSNFTMRSDGSQVFNYYERSDNNYQRDETGGLIPEQPDWATSPLTDANGDIKYLLGGEPIGLPIAGRETEELIMPPAGSIRRQDTDRSREGFATSLQFANTDETFLATAEFIRSDSQLSWNERFVEFADQAFESPRANDATLINNDGTVGAGLSGGSVSFDNENLFTHGILSGPNYVNGVRLRAETSLIDDASLKLQFTPNDNLAITTDFQYIEAESSVVDNTIHTISSTDVYLDVRGEVPEVQFLSQNWSVNESGQLVINDDSSLSDPQNVTFRSMMDHISESKGKSVAFSLDGEYTFDDSPISSVQAGLRVSDKEQEIYESDYNWGNISQEWNDTASKCAEYKELCEYYDFGSDFHTGDVLTGVSGFWFPKMSLTSDTVLLDEYVLRDQVPDVEDDLATQGIQSIHARNSDAGRENLRSRDDVILGTPYLPTEIYLIEEDRQAAYVRINFDLEANNLPIRGNLGWRYVSYELSSTGGSNFGGFSEEFLTASNYTNGEVLIPESDLAFATDSGGEVTTVEAPKFTKLLPSLNISYEAVDGLIFRLAASQGIFLPELENVRNNFTISANASGFPDGALEEGGKYDSVTVNTYTANDVGNPLLQPEESTNIDLTAEWYFSDVGSVTLAAFTKDLKNIHRKQGFPIDVTNPNTGITKTVSATGTKNAGDAEITGFEFAYQQTFDMLPGGWSGLGAQFNYTFIDAEQTSENEPLDPNDQEFTFRAFNDLPLEGLSEDTLNLAVFYENELLSTRLAYNWRSEYLLNSRDVITFSPIYSGDVATLDGSFFYNVNDNIEIGFEVNNILDTITETSIQYDQAGTTTPRSFFVQDRRFALVLNASF